MTPVFAGCGGEKGDAATEAAPLDTAVTAAAEALTDKGYALKKEARNRDALLLFEQAASQIASAGGRNSEAFASSLDDQATIYLRTGDPEKAKSLYLQAAKLLEDIGKTDTRLFAGIHRRLKTIDALASMNIRCSEPLSPDISRVETDSASKIDSDAVTSEPRLPYFPDVAALQRAYGKFNLQLKHCLDDFRGALPVWSVVTGDGRIALVSVKSETLDRKTRECIEQGLLQVSKTHRDELPRFSACYRNFTFPLAFRK